jgi:NAD+ kinase
VIVYAGAKRAKLVRVTDMDFLGRVRQRFGLPDSAAAIADGAAPPLYSPSDPLPPDLAHPGPPD